MATLTVSTVALLLLLTGALPWASWWPLLLLPALGYTLGISYATARIPDQRGIRDRAITAATLVTMHLSWGIGFLRGIMLGGAAPGGRHVVDRSRT